MRCSSAVRTLCVIALAGITACSKQTPSAPTPATPAPTPHPNIAVASVVVQGSARSVGYEYAATIQLKETAGVAATISSVDLVFLNGTTTLASSHTDHPISDTANLCPANGTIATKLLVTDDADASHVSATTVQVKVAFTDSSGFAGAATGSADVAAVPAAAQTFSLTGVITDSTTHAGLAGAQLEVLNGQNAGKVAIADGTGSYAFPALTTETFRLRASAADHDSGEQNVTVPMNPRADFELRSVIRPSPRPGCPAVLTYNEPPAAHQFLGGLPVGCIGTSAIDVTWLRFDGTHGNGTQLDLVVDANSGAARTGHLTFSDGGAVFTTFIVNQAAGNCVTAISPASQSFDETGGTGVVAVTAQAGCSWQAVIPNFISSAIPAGGQGVGSGTLSFTVARNTEMFPRSGSLVIGLFSDELTQASCPVSVSTSNVHVPSGGGTFSVTVTAGQTYCNWSDVSNSPFIDRAREVRAGTGPVTFVVSANTTGQSRGGSLTVAGQSVFVTQDQ